MLIQPKSKVSPEEKRVLKKMASSQIEGFNNEYTIYENYTIIRRVSGRVRKVNVRLNSAGYLSVCLHGKNRLLHRLYAAAFLPNPDNLPVINHKNGIKTDNRLRNLEWCTASHNCQHAHRTGLIKKSNLRATSKCKPVEIYKPNGKYITTAPSIIAAANRLKCSRFYVSDTCNGRLKTTGKYIMRFKLETA